MWLFMQSEIKESVVLNLYYSFVVCENAISDSCFFWKTGSVYL